MSQGGSKSAVAIIESPKTFFRESLKDALSARKVETFPLVETYLVEILDHYVVTTNLFDEEPQSGKRTRETLAEMFLRAGSSPTKIRVDLLKKLGDSALYISGFFGDSFQRKVIDVDYYIDMGTTAYSSLSKELYEDTYSQLYSEIAKKFSSFVDVFTVMSRKTSCASENENILRLMDVYSKTGSEFAHEQLVNKGVFTSADQLKSCKNQ